MPSFLFLLLLFFLLLPSSSPASSPPPPSPPLQAFLQCLTTNHSVPSELIFTQQSSGYQSVLLSSVQNTRFVVSGDTTKPAAILKASSASHAQAAVLCCRQTGLRLRVRSGGHDYEGASYVSTSSSSGGKFVVVDLSGLRSITFDATQGTAWVESGATIGELYYAIGKKYSANAGFPAGVCHTVGIGGHFSGGGIGPLVRKFGTSADNVVGALVIDAEGELLDRSAMGEDLFWAIRGGGAASFGVVVAFQIKLVALPSTVTAFRVVRDLSQGATGLVAKWQTAAPAMDENLYIKVVAQAIGNGAGGRTIQAMFTSLYLGRRDEMLAALAASLPELGVQANDCVEMSWLESTLYLAGHVSPSGSVGPAEKLLDRTPEFNSSFKAKSDFVAEPINETDWEAIWRRLASDTERPLNLIMEPMGGAMSNISEAAIAFPHRKGNLYELQYFMRWAADVDRSTTEGHLEWMREVYGFMAPFVSSDPRAAYYNYKDADLGGNVVVGDGEGGGDGRFEAAEKTWGKSYFKGNLRRLAAVKTAVDHDEFFWNEHSIPPLAGAAGGMHGL